VEAQYGNRGAGLRQSPGGRDDLADGTSSTLGPSRKRQRRFVSFAGPQASRKPPAAVLLPNVPVLRQKGAALP
jgi:hypothetical protein